MCEDVGVKLIYLSPYSTDLNPIEEYFAELKGFIRRNWNYKRGDFMPFLNGESMWWMQKKRTPKAISGMHHACIPL